MNEMKCVSTSNFQKCISKSVNLIPLIMLQYYKHDITSACRKGGKEREINSGLIG